jgi:DUF971 family protein
VDAPVRIDIRKNLGLVLEWPEGQSTFYSVAYLRRMSPSADMRQLRETLARNPLTVLPSSPRSAGPVAIASADYAGNYGLKIEFSDGHSTGIYSFAYLREIDQHIDPTPEFDASCVLLFHPSLHWNRRWNWTSRHRLPHWWVRSPA